MVEEVERRKKEILKAIIHEHIFTAEPVGSRTLAKSYELGVSSATIRNEMSDLEELGYLEQPYTSAGRIPSDKAYRFYVDTLINDRENLNLELIKLLNNFNYERQGIQQIMSNMAKMLSSVTRYTSVVSEPQMKKSRIKQIQLIPVEGKRILIVLITNTGIVHNKIVKLKQDLNPRQLGYLNEYLFNNLKDKRIKGINNLVLQELEKRLIKRLDLSQEIIELVYKGLEMVSKEDDFKIYLGGTSYILEQPEFNDLDNLKKVLNILDHEEMLKDLLVTIPNKELEVMIGHENKIEEMKKCSLVFASYTVGDIASGKIGVIGPTRMEYSRVIASVNTVAELMGKIISELSG
ncbi:heat-inducible transcriptional repressor HrcA [Halocella sp. SP3-1]|uniref:heat-inducible transcriptional repressor HrcA n=1 Tax=Halocella sp. SP3-1 TaxID=2382161 RepID=UPI000F757D00|nr:heat-inducible transcriptional repressor HrcA [Halocella sp. SP3-1]AZO94998.1 heat-inducible transcription repressor HrcA [Halocella sp. SP3-1]MTI61271.1 heat-inducible transcription repressor HrcA [Bacillota bacterium]